MKNGTSYNLNFSNDFRLSDSTILEIKPVFYYQQADMQSSTYFGYGIELGAVYKVEYLTLSVNTSNEKIEYETEDPFWEIRRSDIDQKLNLELSSDYIQYDGMIPKIVFYLEKNTSSIDYYSFNNNGVGLTIKKVF